ncbi:MAG TPA: DinB family protein [Symbiobacteriaceae bacterium]|nr:DinB family protein [Symbiobacteriaceae bacterium]
MTVEHEARHRHQLLEALAAARGDERAALNVERQSAAALQWAPPSGKWSAAEHAIHLAVWDRYVAAVLAAKADGGPAPAEPYPEGGLDAWNQAEMAARAWQSLDAVLHELGAARGDLTAQIRRLPQPLFASEAEGLRAYTGHDLHHSAGMRRVLREWRQC